MCVCEREGVGRVVGVIHKCAECVCEREGVVGVIHKCAECVCV